MRVPLLIVLLLACWPAGAQSARKAQPRANEALPLLPMPAPLPVPDPPETARGTAGRAIQLGGTTITPGGFVDLSAQSRMRP